MEVPEVRFADSDGVAIAWTQWGSGPDLLVVPPLVSNQELQWEHELYRRYFEHVGQDLRITTFDKRGIGISDRFDGVPTLEQRAADIRAVMEAAGLEHPSLMGLSEGGLMVQLFAALHPDRVDRVVLANSGAGPSTFADAHVGPDGSYDPLVEKLTKYGRLVETWGRDPQFMVDWFAPSQSDNASFVRWMGRYQRTSATAADLQRQIASVSGLDASERLAEISAPTLVMHGARDRVIPVAVGRAVADAIPGSTFVELDTDDHFLLTSAHWSQEADRMTEFVTGSRPQPRLERRFATVVFTDIVGSTAQAATAGDERWCDVLDSHDRISWKAADRHRGTIVNSTGDGHLVRFDSPLDAVEFCSEVRGALSSLELRIRCGVHVGEIELRDSGDIAGTAVNLAARVEHAADDGEIFVSSTVHDMLLGGGPLFEDRGLHHLKGFEDPWHLFSLVTTER